MGTGTRLIAVPPACGDQARSHTRANTPPLVYLQHGNGTVEDLHARSVHNAFGTWSQPNPLGHSGLPTPGEQPAKANGLMTAPLPDVLDTGRELFSTRHLWAMGAEQLYEFFRHKSIHHRKESDHPTWVILRVSDAVKAVVVELQYDENGAGDLNRLHATVFARGLEASGLDTTYGASIDEAPLKILEQNNAMSLFGLIRPLRAASLGSLAPFDATSSVPSRRVAQGLDRLGFSAKAQSARSVRRR